MCMRTSAHLYLCVCPKYASTVILSEHVCPYVCQWYVSTMIVSATVDGFGGDFCDCKLRLFTKTTSTILGTSVVSTSCLQMFAQGV